ncbi:MAG: TIGR04282 family arsenosugar biosynthesis glycosyltransferase [Myxococcales bacterium]|nr:TIGR04282 family arsenosugar biosynthesis glycosyltransferase [Myxococcales bacterium]
MKTRLIVLARAPALGRGKTRLARDIGQGAALRVYRALLERTGAAIRAWPGAAELYFEGDASLFGDTAVARLPRFRQVEGGLGRRLAHAAERALATRERLIIVGADCPDLTVGHLAALAQRLDGARVALGPARDGGYWGVGVTDPEAAKTCFADDLPWSTQQLLDATGTRLGANRISCALGPTLDDVDDLEGLARAEARGFEWRRQPEELRRATTQGRARGVRAEGTPSTASAWRTP